MARRKQSAGKAKGSKRASSPDDNGPAKLPRTDSENTKLREAITAVHDEAAEASASSGTAKLDAKFAESLSGKASVFGEYACMLNQTDVINNNNKFYVIQIAQQGKKFFVFNRWGRVGEDGQSNIEECSSADESIKSFTKKFQSKTGNNWEKRDNFTAKTKKYTLLVMDTSENDDEAWSSDVVDSKATVKREAVDGSGVPCSLDQRSQLMLKLIFNNSMFEKQMAEMNLDVRKMPLGKLSKVQIAKGLEVLIEIEEAVKKNEDHNKIAALSSKFFTLVPHSFGRQRPPVLNSAAVIRQKKDVMITLSDIELTQSLQKVKKEPDEKHPLDVHYESLCCTMRLMENKCKEFKLIKDYVRATSSTGWKLLDVWHLDRQGEADRFSVNKAIAERKLLWHGTSVAVVAAILNSGLRIMPHSGGLVGKGIYFASEHSKSANYVGAHFGQFEGEENVCFMFLSEVALGKVHEIEQCDGSLVKAPPGYDSIVARGQREPDPSKDAVLTLDGSPVKVPVGRPVDQKKFKNSNFYQSEYLVYNEHQAAMVQDWIGRTGLRGGHTSRLPVLQKSPPSNDTSIPTLN